MTTTHVYCSVAVYSNNPLCPTSLDGENVDWSFEVVVIKSRPFQGSKDGKM